MSAPINDGGPASPCGRDVTLDQFEPSSGMSLRDYFAAKAMQAAYFHFSSDAGPAQHWTTEGVAESAYAMADEMLKARAT